MCDFPSVRRDFFNVHFDRHTQKEIMSHGREVARTHAISHVTRASYSSHGHSGFPWGDFPSFPELS